MALNTVSSDRLSTNVKNTNFTAAEKQDLTNDILPLAGQLGNRNLIINGAFQIAQRLQSSASNGYKTVDRWLNDFGNLDEAGTQAQVDVASGTTPYTLGFRKSLKWTNGNQTSGAGAGDYIGFSQKIEAQNIANSGWNYTSSSSNITLSFWVKSSVAQNFYGYLHAPNASGGGDLFPFETGSLSADTWTKITKTISGNSNLVFDNSNLVGLQFQLWAFIGTTYTGTVTLNQWATYDSSVRTPNNTSTWYTTNDATLEITGVQLEVGSVATEFEHRSFGQELELCKRYYQKTYSYGTAAGTSTSIGVLAKGMYAAMNYAGLPIEFNPIMRATPTIVLHSTNNGNTGKISADSGDGNAATTFANEKRALAFRNNDSNGTATNAFLRVHYTAEAEL